MTISQDAAGLVYGQVIELLEIDLTPFGGAVYRIYNSIDTGDALGEIEFLGVQWSPVPFESEGWGANGSGGTPRPVITVADFDSTLLTASIAYQDLIGAKVYRYETTTTNIATDSYYGPEIWLVNQKMESDGNIMKIGLAAPMDQKTKKLPAWQMWRTEFPALSRNRV